MRSVSLPIQDEISQHVAAVMKPPMETRFPGWKYIFTWVDFKSTNRRHFLKWGRSFFVFVPLQWNVIFTKIMLLEGFAWNIKTRKHAVALLCQVLCRDPCVDFSTQQEQKAKSMTLLQIAVQWISELVTTPKNYYHTHTRMKVVPFKSPRLKKKRNLSH